MTKTIILYPYKIDKEGTIHIRAMVKSKCKGYKARMKRLVAMGIFVSKELIEITSEDKIPVTGTKLKIEVKNNV